MKQSEDVHRLSAQLMTLQDEERRRIARNLHDSVGQLVVAAMLQVSTIQEEENRLTQVAATSVQETASSEAGQPGNSNHLTFAPPASAR